MQLERLKKIIGWAYEKSRFYQQSFDKAGVKPDDLQTLDDIKKFPFLTLSELNREDSMDFLTLPLSSIIRINYVEDSDAGINVTNFYTRDDIIKNVEMMIRCLQAAKIYRGSIVGVRGELSDSRFLDVIYALESIGATVIQIGESSTLEKIFADVVITSPEFAAQMIYPVRKIICLNKNFPNPLQSQIEHQTGATVYNLFAPLEIGIAGIIFQCGNAFSVQEDNFLIETVHVDDDEQGELVITTLTAQARPLIRYRTKIYLTGKFLCRL